MNNKSIVSLTHHGNFNNAQKFFERCKQIFKKGQLDKYGDIGVKYLEEFTPKKTGLTSRSWYYEINSNEDGYELVWKNSNIQGSVHVAIVLQYGHGTKSGTWVEGIDYINPALEKIFEKITDDAEKEVKGIL